MRYEPKPPRILRREEAQARLGLERTAFDNAFVYTRLKKVQITKRAVGFLESDIDNLVRELARKSKGAA